MAPDLKIAGARGAALQSRAVHCSQKTLQQTVLVLMVAVWLVRGAAAQGGWQASFILVGAWGCSDALEADTADMVQVPVGIALDDLIKLGQEIVPGGASSSTASTPALGTDDMSPMKLAAYLASQVCPSLFLLSQVLLCPVVQSSATCLKCHSHIPPQTSGEPLLKAHGELPPPCPADSAAKSPSGGLQSCRAAGSTVWP